MNSPRRQRPGLRLWPIGPVMAIAFFAAVFIASIVFYAGWDLLGVQDIKSEKRIDSKTLFDLVKLSFGVVAGAGALVALIVAYRRQRVDEAGALRDATRLHTERFTTAVGQLGSESAAVRLGGVHALAGLADDAPTRDLRQTAIDVLCAYLRLPYTAEADLPRDEAATRHEYLALREVRHTVIRVIRDRLRLPQEHAHSWQGYDFDFTNVVFDGGDFSGAVFSRGTASFTGAQFSSGEVSFHKAQFTGGMVYFSAALFCGGTASFDDAQFSDGSVSFEGTQFSDGSVSFERAQFSDGRVSFADAQFSGSRINFYGADFRCRQGWVSFADAQFSNGRIYFDDARFSAGRIDFNDSQFLGGSVSLDRANFSGGTASFDSAQFAAGQISFDEARLSNGLVTFNGTQFSGAATSFARTQFSGATVNFDDAQFNASQVSFEGASFFDGSIDFTGAEFSGSDIDFSGAEFCGSRVSFDTANFSGGTLDFDQAFGFTTPVGLPSTPDSFMPPGLRMPSAWFGPSGSGV